MSGLSVANPPNPVDVFGHAGAKIAVHAVDLDLLASAFDGMPAELSDEEKERAARFATPQLVHRFAAGRVFLRRVLARERGISPTQVALHYGPHGKPYLRTGATPLWFNLSHAGETAVLAISNLDEVGIDIEKLENSNACDDIAEVILSPKELHRLNIRRGSNERHELLRYWTAKEAYLKLIGTGLSFDPRRIEVAWANAREGSIQSAENGRHLAFLRAIDVGPDALCCLASRIPLRHEDVRLFDVSVPRLAAGAF
jgi:phosphopantetheine--protein transferase-like protein